MRLKARFTAARRDGTTELLNVWVRDIDTSTLRGRSSVEGMPSIRTADGRSVNRLGGGRYQIVQTGEILESTDLNSM